MCYTKLNDHMGACIMKIRSINITEFGGLKNFSLDFSESLNIITGDNESGKSTVLLFIAYMLYGIAKKGANAALDKARSISWEGSRAEGQMDVIHGGKEYRITRTLKGKTSVSNFKVFDLESGAEVDCDSPAELFLGGVSRETFESCCLCGQLRAAAINGTQVSETLSNLSLGADESVNADAVIETVRKARKEYKHERGKGGLIDSVTDELTDISQKKLIAENALNAQNANKAALEEKKREHEAVTKRLGVLKKIKERKALLSELDKFEEYGNTKKALSAAKEHLANLTSSFGFSKKEPNAIELGEMRHLAREYQAKKDSLSHIEGASRPERSRIDIKAKEYAERIILGGGKDAALANIAKTRKRVGAFKLTAIISAVLAVIFLALSAITLIFMAGCFIFGVLAVICFTLSKKTQRSLTQNGMSAEEYIEYCFAQLELFAAEEAAEKKAEEAILSAKEALDNEKALVISKLSEYSRDHDGTPLDSLYLLISDVTRYIEDKSGTEQKISLYNSLLTRQKNELDGKDEEKLKADLLNVDIDDSLVSDVDGEILLCQALEKKLSGEMTELRIKIEGSADNESTIASLEEKRIELEAKKAEFTEKYEIFSLALEALEEARDNLQRAFAPEVRRKAGDMLSRISGKKYSSLFLSQKLEASVDSAGSPRSAELLSGGTSDALYIALRLALIDSIFGTDAPLIFDETLSQVDDKRAAEVLTLISDFSERGGQGLFFTCHKREAALCTEHGISHKSIII